MFSEIREHNIKLTIEKDNRMLTINDKVSKIKELKKEILEETEQKISKILKRYSKTKDFANAKLRIIIDRNSITKYTKLLVLDPIVNEWIQIDSYWIENSKTSRYPDHIDIIMNLEKELKEFLTVDLLRIWRESDRLDFIQG